MQGGQEPGRGVYVVRRIVAVLVILLLLILLVPRACETFIGQGGNLAPERRRRAIRAKTLSAIKAKLRTRSPPAM